MKILGDIQTKDIFTKKADTAWSQLLEAQANRDGHAGIMVFDVSLVDSSVLAAVQDVRFIPGIGLIAIIDSQKGDYRNLAIAYMLARDIALNTKTVHSCLGLRGPRPALAQIRRQRPRSTESFQ